MENNTMENLKKIQEEKEYWNATAMDLLNSNKKLVYQLEKLEAEKKELLEALEKCNKFLYDFKQQSIDDAYKLQSETISLIQKHKQ